MDTRALKDVLAINAVSGTRSYSLPTDILFDLRATFNGIAMVRTSEFDLDKQYYGDWSQQTSSQPGFYYVDLDPNNQKIYIFQSPTVSLTGGINLEYVKIPPVLSSDASVPWDGHTLLTPYHNAIVYWASSYLIDADMSQQNLFNKREWQKEYNKLVNACVETFKDLEFSKPMRIRGGRYFKGL